MLCSIAMSTRNKAEYLDRTLETIRKQEPDFDYEIIIADDGSTDKTEEVCKKWKVEKYIRLENDTYRNPSKARNTAYRACKGDIIIAQSDEVMHLGNNVIYDLCNQLHAGEFLIATVYNYDVKTGQRLEMYTGIRNQRPFFFLGSLTRKDLYAVGGNDEEFVNPGYDDDWFGDCLIYGLKLKVRYLNTVVGYHQKHMRLPNLKELVAPSRELYFKKKNQGKFISSGGAWEYK